MSTLPIRLFGDPVLNEMTTDYDNIDGAVAALAETMIETMYAAPGVGLAALSRVRPMAYADRLRRARCTPGGVGPASPSRPMRAQPPTTYSHS